MRFDREMDSKLDSKLARESSLPIRRTVHFPVHLMAISNITRLDAPGGTGLTAKPRAERQSRRLFATTY